MSISRDSKGRYIDKHDAEIHIFQDYNDYYYIDSLRKCDEVDWIK